MSARMILDRRDFFSDHSYSVSTDSAKHGWAYNSQKAFFVGHHKIMKKIIYMSNDVLDLKPGVVPSLAYHKQRLKYAVFVESRELDITLRELEQARAAIKDRQERYQKRWFEEDLLSYFDLDMKELRGSNFIRDRFDFIGLGFQADFIEDINEYMRRFKAGDLARTYVISKDELNHSPPDFWQPIDEEIQDLSKMQLRTGPSTLLQPFNFNRGINGF